MFLLHSFCMEDGVVIGAASSSAWPKWLVKLICFLQDVLLRSPFAPRTTARFQKAVRQGTSRCWPFISEVLTPASSQFSVCILQGLTNNSLSQMVSISHHICLVVRVEMLRNRPKQIIFGLQLLVIPVRVLLCCLFVSQFLCLDNLGSRRWIHMRAELIFNLDGNFLYFMSIISQQFECLNPLMSQLILLSDSSLVLYLNDASLAGHAATRLCHRCILGTLACWSIHKVASMVTAIEIRCTVHGRFPSALRQPATWRTLGKFG